MNTLARNFSHTFRRFFTASVLNIIGLAIAFASFFVIMTQVDYDLNFNKGYKDYEKIFRLEIKPNEEWGWQLWTPRPIAELIGTASPHVQAYAMTGWVNDNDYEVNGNLFNETTAFGFGDFMKVFQPEMIAGSTDALEKKDNVLIPASMAMRMFGSTDAVGKMLFQGKQSDNKPVTVGGVYKDFPENSQIGNHIFMPFDPDQDKNDWGNWNYTCYYRLDNPANVSEVEKLAFQQLLKVAPGDLREGLKQEKDNSNFFNLAPLSEVHFSKIGNKSASSRTTVYELHPCRNADAHQEHQHAKGIGSHYRFVAQRAIGGIRTHQPHSLCGIHRIAAHLARFRRARPRDGKPQPEQTSSFNSRHVRHQYFDWRAGGIISFFLRHLVPSCPRAERFVRALA